MAWHEQPGCLRPRYLFKQKLTANEHRAIGKIAWPEWSGQPSTGLEQCAEIQRLLQRQRRGDREGRATALADVQSA